MCLLIKDEEIKELPNLDNEVVPRNPVFGDGTLPYRSMDCLKHQLQDNRDQIDALDFANTDMWHIRYLSPPSPCFI